jgi:hypothetical protein
MISSVFKPPMILDVFDAEATDQKLSSTAGPVCMPSVTMLDVVGAATPCACFSG